MLSLQGGGSFGGILPLIWPSLSFFHRQLVDYGGKLAEGEEGKRSGKGFQILPWSHPRKGGITTNEGFKGARCPKTEDLLYTGP